jgi:mannose-6-phosphate isomerase-like protein (cupin superfamily)
MPCASEPTCQGRSCRRHLRWQAGPDLFLWHSGRNCRIQGYLHALAHHSAGRQGKGHMHKNHETAIYVLEGEAIALYGDRLQHHAITKAGDLFYIPAGVPHLPINLSDKPISAVIARTDPNEQESVILLPELEAYAEEAIARLKSTPAASTRPA